LIKTAGFALARTGWRCYQDISISPLTIRCGRSGHSVGSGVMSMSSPEQRSAHGAWAVLRRTTAVTTLAWALTSVPHGVARADELASSPALHIVIGDAGRAVFEGMVDHVARASGLTPPPQVRFVSAVTALREFCRATGNGAPDIALTTRRMPAALVDQCRKNGVQHIAQVNLGRNAMILAVRQGSPLTNLSAHEVYLALARDVPDRDEFRRNASIRWSDIDRSLPPLDIRFHLPPRESAGRPLFNSAILQGGCREEPLAQAIVNADQRTQRCTQTRLERVREIPESQSIRALLEAPEGTIGVFNHKDIEQAEGKLVGIVLDGVTPDRESVINEDYEYSTRYYLYAKRGQALRGRPPELDQAIDRVIADALTDDVLGMDGLMDRLGLIPLPDETRIAQRELFYENPRSVDMAAVGNWLGSAVTGAGKLGQLVVNLLDIDTSASAFDSLMDLAGYKTQELQTSIGVIPSAGMTFGMVREMSEADQEYLDRRLEKDRHERPDLLATMQRSIVRSVLDVSEVAGYDISKVEIEIVPLPQVRLFAEPKDGGPKNNDTATILREIERLNERMNEVTRY
jgi:phosphate transport system substrate-binding protein